MFVLCGYDACSDKNTLNETPIPASRYDSATLTNGIFNHWYVTGDARSEYSSEIPTTWDLLTIMSANFNGHINAGNIDYSLSEINGFKIKRRKTTEFDWVTLKYIPISELDDLSFVFNDNLAVSGYEYEYAFTPVIGEIEGDYISNTIGAKFEGVFICDQDTIYKFLAGVRYGTNQKVQKIGVFEPYGRRYPVIVSNGLINYETGSVSGTVLPSDYTKTGAMDRLKITTEKKALFDFLTNKKAKILKDWNGASWLICVVGNPSAEYNNDFGMGKIDVSADWAQVGDDNNQKDLYRNGMVNEVS